MRLRNLYLGSETPAPSADAEEGQASQSAADNNKTASAPLTGQQLKEPAEITKYMKQNHAFYLIMNLDQWVFRLSIVYLILLVILAILLPLQNRNSVVTNNRMLVTPLTQNVGVWTPSSLAKPVSAGPFGSDLSFAATQCPVYDGINFTDSGYFVRPVTLSYSSFDGRYMVLISLISATVFGMLGSFKEDWYYAPLYEGNNHAYIYFERSVSISVMMVTMCAQMGVTDIWTILNVLANTWVGIMLCFFAEVLFREEQGRLALWEDGCLHYHAIAIVAAWLALAVSFCTVYSHIALLDRCFNVNSTTYISRVLVAIVYIELVLVGGMLFVQTASQYFKRKPSKVVGNVIAIRERTVFTVRVEAVQLALDFMSKIVFCVMVFTNSLVGAGS